jgi:hypothetical protein
MAACRNMVIVIASALGGEDLGLTPASEENCSVNTKKWPKRNTTSVLKQYLHKQKSNAGKGKFLIKQTANSTTETYKRKAVYYNILFIFKIVYLLRFLAVVQLANSSL